MTESIKIGVIGLGYVGLPLACLMAGKYEVMGFDKQKDRIAALHKGLDQNLQFSKKDLKLILKNGLTVTDRVGQLKNCTHYIITVPTPVDESNKPDMKMLFQATRTVGKLLSKGDVVIFESTVYPGATEEECVPILEEQSRLIFNQDFFVGYSPERINPGDQHHSLEKIVKVTSGSTPEIAEEIDSLYASVIKAGTYLAPSIKVAEAAKVIENAQRDINIAFVNELAKILNLMEIDTHEVLQAAKTKWNFLNFQPGLVGGHCIGVDPYYLAQKAIELDYHPEIILAGRRINDNMGKYISSEVLKLLLHRNIKVKDSKVLVLGITFKENCTDHRNTRVIDIIDDLSAIGADVHIFDPWANPEEIRASFGLELFKSMPEINFDAIILAVSHREFSNIYFRDYLKENGILYDVKGFLDEPVDGRL